LYINALYAKYYPPGGMLIPGRNFSSEKYRFGFNGKENCHEILSQGRWQDYGERDYRPDLVRFIKIDPLTRKYPELSSYQFASNTPIQAIDQDGLEAFIVHGTQQTQTGVNFTSESVNEFKRIGGNTTSDDKFRWDAPLYNDANMRKVAARELVQHIVETRAKMMANGDITENEPITLIGYSHGGNVSIQASKMLNDQFGIKVNVITIGTPAKNSAFNTDSDNWLFGNSEDPQGNPGINSHYHIRHIKDMVWKIADAAGDKSDSRYSNEPTTTNWDIPNTGIKFDSPIKSHTDLPSHPKFGSALKQLPKMPVSSGAGKLEETE
jgi:RHS repeat-associated protein